MVATPPHAGAAPAAAKRVWVIGDSVMVGASSSVSAALGADGWQPTIIDWPGMELSAVTQILTQRRADLPPVIVMEIGNNWCCDPAAFGPQIDQAMRAVEGAHVIWLTDALFRIDQTGMNAQIRAAAGRWPNMEVTDWSAVVAAHPEAVYADHLHLTPAGQALMARLVVRAVDAWYAGGARAGQPVMAAFGSAPAETVPATGAVVVGGAATPSGAGAWVATAAGDVLTVGDAVGEGSMAGVALSLPVVGMAATPTGRGYWLVAADGGVFSFGDAAFHGSEGGQAGASPVVGMAATASGQGYRLVASDGHISTFGDATALPPAGGPAAGNVGWVGVIAPSQGGGYWLLGEQPA
ncbi:MAG TPA: hypothetical protein VMU14_01005 [Acidimicrobiales bacterium]|nr:hypothetical protein [Acidimicrobiales bacterium]